MAGDLDGGVGLDLGTATSSVAVVRGGGDVEMVPVQGISAIPSMLADNPINPGLEMLFGVEVLEVVENGSKGRAASIIRNIKRIIGMPYSSCHEQFVGTAKISENTLNPEFPVIKTNSMTHVPEEVAGFLLSKLGDAAERHTQNPPLVQERVAIAVPGYFNAAQRRALKYAAKVGGFRGTLRLINDTSAAALAYAAKLQEPRRALVMDLGAGGSSMSIVEASPLGVRVRASLPYRLPGGLDIDELASKWLHQIVEQQLDVRCDLDLRDKDALLHAWNRTKPRLVASSKLTMVAVDAYLPSLKYGLNALMSEHELEGFSSLLMSSLITAFRVILQMAQMDKSQVDDVVLVGGCSRIPVVRRVVKKNFDRSVLVSMDPDSSVAVGAALFAASRMVLEEVAPLGLCYELGVGSNFVLMEPNESIPCQKEFCIKNVHSSGSLLFSTVQKCGPAYVTVARHRLEVKPEQEQVRVLVQVGYDGIPEWHAPGEVLLSGGIVGCEDITVCSTVLTLHQDESERKSLETFCSELISGELLMKEAGETLDWLYANPDLHAAQYLEKKHTLQALLDSELDDQDWGQTVTLPVLIPAGGEAAMRALPSNRRRMPASSNDLRRLRRGIEPRGDQCGDAALARQNALLPAPQSEAQVRQESIRLTIQPNAQSAAQSISRQGAQLTSQPRGRQCLGERTRSNPRGTRRLEFPLSSLRTLLLGMHYRVASGDPVGDRVDAVLYPELSQLGVLSHAFNTPGPLEALSRAVVDGVMGEVRAAGRLCLLLDTLVTPESEYIAMLVRYVHRSTYEVLERLVVLLETREASGQVLYDRFDSLCEEHDVDWKTSLCGVSTDTPRVTQEAFIELQNLLRQNAVKEVYTVYNGAHNLCELVAQAGECLDATADFFGTLGAMRELFAMPRRAEVFARNCGLNPGDVAMNTYTRTVSVVTFNFRAMLATLADLKLRSDSGTSFVAKRVLFEMKTNFLPLLVLYNELFLYLRNVSVALSYSQSITMPVSEIQEAIDNLEKDEEFVAGVIPKIAAMRPEMAVSEDEQSVMRETVKNAVETIKHYLLNYICVVRDVETISNLLEISEEIQNPSLLFNWLEDVNNEVVVSELLRITAEYTQCYANQPFASPGETLMRVVRLNPSGETLRERYPTLLRCLEEVLTLPLVPPKGGIRKLHLLHGYMPAARRCSSIEAALVIRCAVDDGEQLAPPDIRLAMDLILSPMVSGFLGDG